MRQPVSQAFKRRVRIVSLLLFAWVSIDPVGSVLARSRRTKDLPVIRVGIYNYTQIHRSQLHEAEIQSAALFAMAGVRIEWVEHLHKAPSAWTPPDEPRPDFSLRILNASTIERSRGISGPDALGQSFIPPGTNGPFPGGIANVYYDRVRELSSEWGPFTTSVLGEAIAHELGHLILGPKHSRQGIMKTPWTHQEQRVISHCDLRFLPQQAVKLQRAVRSLHQEPPAAVLARR
jgi:hypothetical protein